MTRARGQTRRRRGALLAAAVAAGLVFLAVGAGSAAASPVALQQATGSCWRDVVNDWLAHQPNVLGSYPIPCYTQAIQHLNSYQDIAQYSNAPDDIHRALLAALANNRGGPSSGSGVGGPPIGPGSGTGGPAGPDGPASRQPNFFTRIFNTVGPGDAQSVPLPLLVLAGLAVLLLLAAAGTWLAKRIQARRMTPAPAPAPRR